MAATLPPGLQLSQMSFAANLQRTIYNRPERITPQSNQIPSAPESRKPMKERKLRDSQTIGWQDVQGAVGSLAEDLSPLSVRNYLGTLRLVPTSPTSTRIPRVTGG